MVFNINFFKKLFLMFILLFGTSLVLIKAEATSALQNKRGGINLYSAIFNFLNYIDPLGERIPLLLCSLGLSYSLLWSNFDIKPLKKTLESSATDVVHVLYFCIPPCFFYYIMRKFL